MKERKLILITNDDGYDAVGIHELTDMLRPLGDVIVVAPEGPRSGAACCITNTRPVTLREVSREEGLLVVACSGTPIDCVKLAIEKVCPRDPDLVASGINLGDNLSISVHYSGTMGAALEACMKGLPGVGFSLAPQGRDWQFGQCRDVVVRVASRVLEEGLPQGTCLNVNFPNRDEVLGLRVTRMARGRWYTEWADNEGEPGRYHLTGYFRNLEPEDEGTDCWAVDHGYASLTPIQTDMTNHALLSHSW